MQEIKADLCSTAMTLAHIGAVCRWIDGCLLPTGSTANGMYARCASDCWSQANPFKNDLSGRVALFDFETVYRKGQVHFPPTHSHAYNLTASPVYVLKMYILVL